jgi:hypothetical protein
MGGNLCLWRGKERVDKFQMEHKVWWGGGGGVGRGGVTWGDDGAEDLSLL